MVFAKPNGETAESAATDSFTQNDLDNLVNPWLDMLDNRKGGYKRAPKFPMPIGHSYLLEHHHYTGNAATLAAVDTTLTAMARGGIYDQIGGGFARYSTDEDWLVPHFEKMLYDNAQLISLYANAFQHSKTPLYETVIRETIAFVERELTAPSGGFYAALDADSEGEEGKYYVWSYAELKPWPAQMPMRCWPTTTSPRKAIGKAIKTSTTLPGGPPTRALRPIWWLSKKNCWRIGKSASPPVSIIKSSAPGTD
jgi:uncharacterized protein YyaL (SSP411 family)